MSPRDRPRARTISSTHCLSPADPAQAARRTDWASLVENATLTDDCLPDLTDWERPMPPSFQLSSQPTTCETTDVDVQVLPRPAPPACPQRQAARKRGNGTPISPGGRPANPRGPGSPAAADRIVGRRSLKLSDQQKRSINSFMSNTCQPPPGATPGKSLPHTLPAGAAGEPVRRLGSLPSIHNCTLSKLKAPPNGERGEISHPKLPSSAATAQVKKRKGSQQRRKRKKKMEEEGEGNEEVDGLAREVMGKVSITEQEEAPLPSLKTTFTSSVDPADSPTTPLTKQHRRKRNQSKNTTAIRGLAQASRDPLDDPAPLAPPAAAGSESGPVAVGENGSTGSTTLKNDGSWVRQPLSDQGSRVSRHRPTPAPAKPLSSQPPHPASNPIPVPAATAPTKTPAPSTTVNMSVKMNNVLFDKLTSGLLSASCLPHHPRRRTANSNDRKSAQVTMTEVASHPPTFSSAADL